MEEKEKKKKRKFFSLDNHIQDNLPVRKILRTGSDLAKVIFKIPKIPIRSIDQAVHAWGLDVLSREEIERFRVKRLTYGIVSGVLFLVMLFLCLYSWQAGTFGLFSFAGYTMSMLSIVTLCLIFLWQADMLSGEDFVPFSTYVCKQKWLFSIIAFLMIGSVDVSFVVADNALPMPDAKIIPKQDLSSNLMSMLVGKEWSQYNPGGVNLGVGMTSVLLPILGCLNSMALFFVSVFSIYIYTFGSVQIANSGRWEDSQLFSTFWSPLRTVAAIGLCTPISHGVSALQHLILYAIALSITMGNNVTHEFLKYVSDADGNGSKMFQLSAPVIPLGNTSFPEIFNQLLQVACVQKSFINIMNDQYTDTFYEVEEDRSFFMGKLEGYTIKFNMPSNVSSPVIIIKKDKKSKFNIQVQKDAIIYVFNEISNLADSYITRNVETRGQNAGQIQSRIDKINSKYVGMINAHIDELQVSTKTDGAVKLLKDMTGYGKDTPFSSYGWMTLGIYPFVIAQAQGQVQDAVASDVEIIGSANLLELSRYFTGGESEMTIVQRFYNDVTKSSIDISKESGGKKNFGAVGETQGFWEGVGNVLMGFNGLSVPEIANELRNRNPIAVMYSKGAVLMQVGAIGLTTVGAMYGGLEASSLLNKIPGLKASPIATGVKAVLGLVAGAIKVWTPLLTMGLGMLILFGACCCYLLPVLPMIYWARALVSWSILIIQTLMGSPFWAASHILPEGIGLAGQHARRGYTMLLDLFMRPTLLCCAIIMSMLLLETITKILAIILQQWVDLTNISADYYLLGYIVLSVVFIYIIYMTIKWLFIEAIGSFPSRVIRWCGGSGLDDDTMNRAGYSSDIMAGQLKDMTEKMAGGFKS